METIFFFSYALLATFLLLSSSLPCLSLSDTELNHARRVLKPARTSTIQKFLVPHNRVRAKLGLRPLQWSEKLANFAKSYANQRKKDCALRHSNTNYGENIFWGSGKDWRPSDAVTAWADEKKFYNYKMNSCLQKEDCLHYTQIVWKESLRVGCARVICNNGDTFITCNYDPHEVLPIVTIADTYIIGDRDGWTGGVDYETWAKDYEFHVGDKLLFMYVPKQHNVFKVNETRFDKCIIPPDAEAYTDGYTIFNLTKPGKQWFLCGVLPHCFEGQKVAINVIPGANPPPPGTANSASLGIALPGNGTFMSWVKVFLAAMIASGILFMT